MRNGLAALICAGALLAGSRAEAQFSAPQGPPPGEDFHVELGLMYWTPEPGLVIGSDAFAAVGSEQVDFVQEFGLEEERVREFRATIKPARKHKVRISYVPIRYEESAQIQRTITFNGRTFPVSAQVDAEMEWKLWRFGYEWDFVSRSRGLVGFITELKYNTVNATLSTAAPPASAAVDVTAPVPTIGLIARGYLHRYFSVTAEVTGMQVPDGIGEDFDATFYDVDIYGTVSLGRNLGIQAGYRSITTDYLVDGDSGDLELKGLYFGGMLRF